MACTVGNEVADRNGRKRFLDGAIIGDQCLIGGRAPLVTMGTGGTRRALDASWLAGKK